MALEILMNVETAWKNSVQGAPYEGTRRFVYIQVFSESDQWLRDCY